MALTLPDAFKNRNIVQNWLFQLYYDDESAFLGTSFYDTKVDNVFYRGVVLNKPSIRESINLEQSKSRTGNLSLTLANFSHLGDDFSAEVYGTRKYLNRLVKVYIQPNRATALSDCLLIYTGKLKTISHTIQKVKLNVEAKRPWDGIEVPQLQTSKNNYYPVSYGNYTPNNQGSNVTTSSGDDDFCNRKTLFPIPVEQIRGETVFSLTGTHSIGSDAYPHFYEKELDKFVPLANHASTVSTRDTASESDSTGHVVRFHKNLLKRTLLKPNERVSSGTGWASNDNAFNSDTADNSSSFTLFTFDVEAFVDDATADIKFKMPQLTGVPSALAMFFVVEATLSFNKTGGSGTNRVELINFTYDNEDISAYFEFTGTVSNVTTMVSGSGNTDVSSPAIVGSNSSIHSAFISSGDGWGEDLTVRIKMERVSGDMTGTVTLNLKLYDIIIQATTKLDYSVTTSSGKSEAANSLNDVDFVYCGGDGLPDNGWNSSSAITEIHEAHRDLLHRFTSYTNSNTPTNYSALNTDKDWQIRYWINQPVLLFNVLEKLQFEGGFIFRFNGQNEGEYIFIPDSITTDHTLTQKELGTLDIAFTDVSKIMARMDIEYRKHPATGGYLSTVSASNSSAISDLLIGTNENKKTIRLDAYVGDSSSENDIPTSATSNPNDDWFSYYNQILGSQKLIVKSEVVSPSFYGIDVGDFVAFSDMPVDPFGLDWSGKDFIVTNVSRQLGKLKCEFREV